MFGIGCGAAPDGGTATDQAKAGGLRLSTQEPDALVGQFTYADSVITFESRLTSASSSSVVLEVNGARFDLVRDVEVLSASLDGHGNSLFQEDLRALNALALELDQTVPPTPVGEELYKLSALLGAARPGTVFVRDEIAPQSAEQLEKLRAESAYGVSDEGLRYMCVCRPTGAYASHEHATASHARVTWSAACGQSAPSCEGRCGAGCPYTYNFYDTKDCLDHDECLNHHPSAPSVSSDGDCGAEYVQARDDFLYGSSSTYLSMCP